MKKIIRLSAAVSLAAGLAAPASSLAWNELGARQFALGGAGVADAQGPAAAYWNPAALGRPSPNSSGFAAPFDFELALSGPVVAGAKDLSGCISSGCTNAQIQQALAELNHAGEGLSANAGGGGSIKIGWATVFLHDFVDMGAEPSVDLVHDTVATLHQNTSSLIVRGANISELGAGFGQELPVRGLYIGGDLKIMRAEIGYDNYAVNNSVGNGFNPTDIVKNFRDNTRTSENFGVDVGALWDVERSFDVDFWSWRLGVTGRNLNDPKFAYSAFARQFGVSSYAVNPQWRAGLSFSPAPGLHFAADADLTRNITALDNDPSRYVGGGVEIDVFDRTWINIPLRAGVKHNLAITGDGATFTLGGGVNLLHVLVDVSGEYSNQSIDTQSLNGTTKIPNRLGAAAQLSVLFGGSDNHRGLTPYIPP